MVDQIHINTPRSNKTEIDVIDRLKLGFTFKSVRPIINNKLILLEFKNIKDMNKFLTDNSNKYLMEPIYNLELIDSSILIQ